MGDSEDAAPLPVHGPRGSGNGRTSARRTRRSLLPLPLGERTVRTLWLFGLLAAVRALGLVLVADAVATSIGLVAVANAGLHPGVPGLFSEPRQLPVLGAAWGLAGADLPRIAHHGLVLHDFTLAVLVGGAGIICQAGTQWLGAVLSRRAAADTKEQVRAGVLRRVLATGGSDAPEGLGGTAVLVTRDLDDLDPYFTQTLTSMVSSAVVPLLVGLRILTADPWSALVVVLTVPLVPVFMVLIGMYTRTATTRAQDALHRLGHHLVELAGGLPVLVGLGRAQEVRDQLERVSREQAGRSMATLRVAFLSALALDLVATLSVAVVAVTVGVRLLNGSLALDAGLLALVLAPECYQPLRSVGMAFHASANGVTTAERAQRILRAPVPSVPRSWTAPGDGVAVRGLNVSYPGRSTPALQDLDADLPAGEITAVTGPSGCGKSTLLGVLAGMVLPGLTPRGSHEPVTVTGQLRGLDPERVAWMPQSPRTVGSTALAEVMSYGAEDEQAAASLLEQCSAGHVAHRRPEELSLGELRRVALARTLARVGALAAQPTGRGTSATEGSGQVLVLLDEPTAHVDTGTGDTVLSVLQELRRRHPEAVVVVATHDPRVMALAGRRLDLGPGEFHGGGAETEGGTGRASHDLVAGSPAPHGGQRSSAPLGSADPRPSEAPVPGSLTTFLRLLRPQRRGWAGAVLLGFLGTGFAVALTALSGWLIVQASARPPILLLLVAIVGVRFFGIGRAVLRYAERLQTHRTAFALGTALRLQVWDALARAAVSTPGARGPGRAVARLVGDVDEVRDLATRTVVPVAAGILLHVAAVVLVLRAAPTAWWIQVVVLVCALLVGPWAALRGDRRGTGHESVLRADLMRRVGALLAAAEDLHVNGVGAAVRGEIERDDAVVARLAARGAWAQGLGEAVVTAVGLTASLAVFLVAWPEVNGGGTTAAALAAVSLMNLALVQPGLDVVAAVRSWPACASVLRRLHRELPDFSAPRVPAVFETQATPGDAQNPSHPLAPVSPQDTVVPEVQVSLRAVDAAWPTQDGLVLSHVDAQVSTGRWLGITGPSGAGKSTVLALLMGFLSPARGSVEWLERTPCAQPPTGWHPVDGGHRRVAWCPQDAHLFDSSLRANLVVARPPEDPPTEEELGAVLDTVGLGSWRRSLAQGLDTPVGTNGRLVSGGQRQRVAVARALLTRAPLLLLDEPTAHLDQPAGRSLVEDLRVGTADRAVVMVTHREEDLAVVDAQLHLRPGKTATDSRPPEPPVT